MRDALPLVPSFVALITAVAVTASATYEWAYYFGLGVEFLTFTSAYDYLSASFRWLPTLLASGFFIVFAEIFNTRVEGGRSEDELIAASPTPRLTKLFRNSPYKIGGPILIIGGYFFAYNSENPTASQWIFPSILVWFLFIGWGHSPSKIKEKTSIMKFSIILFGPAIAAVIAGQGYDGARRDLATKLGQYKITYHSGLVETNIHLLRNTAYGLVVLRVPLKTVSFLPYQDIQSIDK